MGNISTVTNNIVYQAWDWILFNTLYKSHSQWPCSEWYHIPTKEELETVVSVLNHFTTVSVASLWTYYFIPPVWYLDRQDWTLSSAYWVIRIWSCTFKNNQVYVFKDETSWISVALDKPSTGVQIRPFANQSVIPDSSYTALFSDALSWWGIFVNHTAWLITVSSDWENWTTFSDKNLWATTYYNGTVSADSTWYFYQSGNNHWFTAPASNTSSTQVNPNWYWPDNRYDSDVFITWSNSWMSRTNDNIRWGIGKAIWVSISMDPTIPTPPTTDWTYTLKCTVNNWVVTYSRDV